MTQQIPAGASPPADRDRASGPGPLDGTMAEAEQLTRRDPARAEALAREVLGAGAGDDRLAGRAHHVVGVCLAYLSRPAEAVEELQRALAAFARAGDRRRAGEAECDLASVRGNHLGMTAEAIEGFERALRSAADEGSAYAEGRALSLLGTVFGRAGRMQEAEAVLRRAVELLVAAGDPYAYATACNNLGYLLELTARHGEAVPILEAALAALDPAEDASTHRATCSSLALALAQVGETARALQLLTSIRQRVEARGGYDLVDYGQNLGRVHLLAGDAAAATAALRAALAEAQRVGLTAPAAECLAWLSQAAERAGDLRTALDCERQLRQLEKRTLDERAAARLGTLETALQLRAREAENAALERSRALLRAVIDADDDLIYAKDENGRYAFVNRAFLVFWDLAEEQLLGRTTVEAFGTRPEVGPAIAADEAVRRSGAPSEIEQDFEVAGGRRRLRVRRRQIASPEGTTWLLGVARDVTELRLNEQRLHEAAQAATRASAAKSRFLANMSHEIRTPINGIMGMIDLAQRAEAAREARQYLGLAQSSAETLLAIVNDILDFSKVEADRVTLESVPFAVHEVLGEVIRPLALKATHKGLDFVARVGEELPPRLLGDPTRLKQVLANLLDNAVKFTDAGAVEIEATVQDMAADRAAIRFAVIDTGPGIAEAQRGAVFEAFTQADDSIARRFGGTGLGLTISARLVELLGGRLRLDSEVGAGSCFSFELSLPLAPGGGAAELPPLPPLTVLWIDANERRREWFVRLLQRWQLRAAGCADPAAAPAGRDALFVDGTPGADGAALQALLRRAPAARVFLLLDAEQPAPPALDPAASERLRILRKPLLPPDLHRALREAGDGGAAPAGAAPAATAPLAGLRILVAEDNPVNMMLAGAVLKRLGAEFRAAEDGAAALALMTDGEFDLVLMDVQMPVLDGVETLARWRALEARELHARRLPVIAMTAHALRGDRERFLGSGFDGYVSKPFRVDDLVDEIARLLGRRPVPRPSV